MLYNDYSLREGLPLSHVFHAQSSLQPLEQRRVILSNCQRLHRLDAVINFTLTMRSNTDP